MEWRCHTWQATYAIISGVISLQYWSVAFLVLEDLEELAQKAPDGPMRMCRAIWWRGFQDTIQEDRERVTHTRRRKYPSSNPIIGTFSLYLFISYIKEGKWSCVCFSFPSAAFFRILVAVWGKYFGSFEAHRLTLHHLPPHTPREEVARKSAGGWNLSHLCLNAKY